MITTYNLSCSEEDATKGCNPLLVLPECLGEANTGGVDSAPEDLVQSCVEQSHREYQHLPAFEQSKLNKSKLQIIDIKSFGAKLEGVLQCLAHIDISVPDPGCPPQEHHAHRGGQREAQQTVAQRVTQLLVDVTIVLWGHQLIIPNIKRLT